MTDTKLKNINLVSFQTDGGTYQNWFEIPNAARLAEIIDEQDEDSGYGICYDTLVIQKNMMKGFFLSVMYLYEFDEPLYFHATTKLALGKLVKKYSPGKMVIDTDEFYVSHKDFLDMAIWIEPSEFSFI